MSESWIVGINPVEGALSNDAERVRELLVEQGQRNARVQELATRAKALNIPVHHRPREQLEKLAGEARHQGVVARLDPLAPQHSLDDFLDGLQAVPLLLVLDGVTDPHNLGACLRVADGAGAQAVIAPKDHAVGLNATVAKVSSGASQTVPYFMVTNLARTLNELKERDIWIVGTSEDAEGTVFDADLRRPVALVMGAEGSGMRQLTRKTCDQLVRLPMNGAVESLNVSVASGICLYEAVRQRS